MSLLVAIQVYHFKVGVAIRTPLGSWDDVMLVNVLSIEEGFATSSADASLIFGNLL